MRKQIENLEGCIIATAKEAPAPEKAAASLAPAAAVPYLCGQKKLDTPTSFVSVGSSRVQQDGLPSTVVPARGPSRISSWRPFFSTAVTVPTYLFKRSLRALLPLRCTRAMSVYLQARSCPEGAACTAGAWADGDARNGVGDIRAAFPISQRLRMWRKVLVCRRRGCRVGAGGELQVVREVSLRLLQSLHFATLRCVRSGHCSSSRHSLAGFVQHRLSC